MQIRLASSAPYSVPIKAMAIEGPIVSGLSRLPSIRIRPSSVAIMPKAGPQRPTSSTIFLASRCRAARLSTSLCMISATTSGRVPSTASWIPRATNGSRISRALASRASRPSLRANSANSHEFADQLGRFFQPAEKRLPEDGKEVLQLSRGKADERHRRRAAEDHQQGRRIDERIERGTRLAEEQDAAHRGEAQDQSEDRGPFHSVGSAHRGCESARYDLYRENLQRDLILSAQTAKFAETAKSR